MKLQAASKRELTRIAVGTISLTLVMVLALYLLSLVGVGTFEWPRIVLGAVLGSAIAIGNFAVLCLTVQKAVDITDQKRMRAKFQLSYNMRMLVQGVWVVVALMVPGIHVVAGALPLLFPHAVILFLQFHGKLFHEEELAKEAENQNEAEKN